ncbi:MULTISPECIES: helix-turn-helix transcriptional regulator [Sphingobium]|uniref:helix-turn-helix transcriptional regulator n=1 Tax=Sphingobium TaxID=165695 RepID=UPI001BE651B3|nr:MULTISPECIES: helix-turn-helix transcriptional regulator [Sphingobium]MBT2246386.1 helix-turn-helix transcriptional regulator [Sphingobium sp. BHU LFT2]WBQ19007.1 helix-turn-helix transcriptional regulator [Sphingobium yanoikuyae]
MVADAWQGSGRTVTSNILPPELEKYRAAVESLTQRQRQCMAHVARGLTSKRIGGKLGIRSGTVDKHIENARNILGEMDRFDAAQIILAFEEPGLNIPADTQFLVPPQSLGIDCGSTIAATVPADHEVDGHPDDDGELVEEQGSYTLERLTISLIDWVPLRSGRRPSNDLNQSKAIVTAAALGALALLLAGSAISLLTVMDSIAHP